MTDTPKPPAKANNKTDPRLEPNWNRSCDNCGEKPTVGKSRLCGPCYFGEGDTAGGNW